MSIFVFLGTDIPKEEARAILDAIYLPSARKGDVLRVAQEKPTTIGLLDECVDSPVHQKEILFALSIGIRVFGGSGMGAVRAAELERFGMTGIGEVFQALKNGRIRDDEVAMHSTTRSGYAEGVTPLVDMEDTFRAAVQAGIICAADVEPLLALAKQLHYAERTYSAIFKLAHRVGIGASRCDRLRAFASAHSPLTRRDAVRVLEEIKKFAASPPSQRTPSFVFERTESIDRLESQIAHLGTDFELIFSADPKRHPEPDAHLAQVTRGGEALKIVRKKILLRLLAVRELNRLGITVSSEDVHTMSNDFRRQFGLTSSADVHAWLTSEGLSSEDFTEVMHDLAAIRITERLYSGEIDRSVPNHIRISTVRDWATRMWGDFDAPANSATASAAQQSWLNCNTVNLGPAAIVRAAAWPIEGLADFGVNVDLLDCCERATKTDYASWSQYLQAYNIAIESERAQIWRKTVEDPEFAKCLAVSNPRLLARARRAATRAKRTKSIRQLELRLYRYFARAIGRTEPCDLWAGVAVAPWGDRTVMSPAPARRRYAPDLRPFQAILRRLSKRTCYRTASEWRPNATLERQPDGQWLFWARQEDGSLVRRKLGYVRMIDCTLQQVLDGAALSGAALASLLAAQSDEPVETLSMLDALIDGGVFVGGLDLPTRFSSPWQALRQSSVRLHRHDREIWQSAVRQLKKICHTLEREHDRLSAEEIAAYGHQAVCSIRKLAIDLHVDPIEMPRVALRCDLRLPFEITLGREQRLELLTALEEYLAWRQGSSPSLSVRMAERERLTDWLGARGRQINEAYDRPRTTQKRPWTWQELAIATGARNERISQLQTLVCGTCDDVVARIEHCEAGPHAPMGMFIAGRFNSTGPGASQTVLIRGIFDEVAPLYARFFELLRVRPRRDPLFGWIKSELDSLSRNSGVQIAELLSPCEFNPNALARPAFCKRAMEIWGVSDDPNVHGVSSARVFYDTQTNQPYLQIPGIPEPVALFSFAAANVGRGDAAVELLLETSFRDAYFANFQAGSMCFEQENRFPMFSRRIRLPGGAVIRTRRTILSGNVLEELAKASQPERFHKWIALARKHSWPALLSVRRDGGPSILVRRDSPLAVAALLHGIGTGAEMLSVEEFPDKPWLVDANGQRHVVELAVPFVRKQHSWSEPRKHG